MTTTSAYARMRSICCASTRNLALAGVLQQVVSKESNDYVRIQCQEMLEELNASMGTF